MKMRPLFRTFWTRRCPGLAAFAVILSLAFLSACSLDKGTEPDDVPPAPPSPLAEPGDARLTVRWEPVDGAERYLLYWGAAEETGGGTRPPAAPSRTVPAGGPLYTEITGLANGTRYFIWIRAENSAGPGGFSPPEEGIPRQEQQEEQEQEEEEQQQEEQGDQESPALRKGFAAVPGGTVTGSDAYTITVTIPNNPEYLNPGTHAVCKGVFVAGRTLTIPAFAMAVYETTQERWYTVQEWALGQGYKFQNETKAPAEARKNRPVTGVSWRDAVVWCNAYSEKDGLDPVYFSGGSVLRDSRDANAAACDAAVMDKTKNGYRLPTEAEREYAARGGDPGKPDWMYSYSGGNDPGTVAWHHGNSPYQVKDVGGKTPNRLGIYDLSGNAQEWGWDWMHYARDATAETPPDGEPYSARYNQKPMMGGGVRSNLTYSCVAKRWSYLPDYTDNYVGFRVVYTL
ncbi:MAG: SUMF1/EgtB/PvdO family nonheme iron enzyme [Treponema sp.]|jgi:formylglycine-generating enzyme required for sulfatase activity|nr:SUMF1/EgtB/PvdO family nonheme iron enzyme [Treponema sp.]